LYNRGEVTPVIVRGRLELLTILWIFTVFLALVISHLTEVCSNTFREEETLFEQLLVQVRVVHNVSQARIFVMCSYC
jgi:hypothetical protein